MPFGLTLPSNIFATFQIRSTGTKKYFHLCHCIFFRKRAFRNEKTKSQIRNRKLLHVIIIWNSSKINEDPWGNRERQPKGDAYKEIAKGIQSIQQAANPMQSLADSLGSARDTPKLRRELTQLRNDTANTIQDVKAYLDSIRNGGDRVKFEKTGETVQGCHRGIPEGGRPLPQEGEGHPRPPSTDPRYDLFIYFYYFRVPSCYAITTTLSSITFFHLAFEK